MGVPAVAHTHTQLLLLLLINWVGVMVLLWQVDGWLLAGGTHRAGDSGCRTIACAQVDLLLREGAHSPTAAASLGT